MEFEKTSDREEKQRRVGNSVAHAVKHMRNKTRGQKTCPHYMLTGKRIGFLINFNVPLMKNGIKRIIL